MTNIDEDRVRPHHEDVHDDIYGEDGSVRGDFLALVGAAIADRERVASANGLANVNPTFSWVRLAQRVPVRIKLDPDNGGVRLIAGRTATVSIEVPVDRRREGDE